MTNLPRVCELCGGDTPATDIFYQRWPNHQRRCFQCWDLEVAIQKQLEIARKILKDLE